LPFRKIPNTDVTYALIAFNAKGKERTDDPDGLMSAEILKRAKAELPTDIFFFSHGWNGDAPAAVDQYNRWIKAMTDLAADRARMGPEFKPLWIGLHWPSLPWGDEELSGDSFDAPAIASSELIDRYAERLGDEPGVRELLERIFRENENDAGATAMPPNVADAYRDLATTLGRRVEGRAPAGDAAPDAEDAPFDPEAAFEAGNEAGDSFASQGIGGLLGPLRQLSFWTMKNRARSIGQTGMHNLIAALQDALPKTKFHLTGHSFGCVVVSSILGGVKDVHPLPRPVDSIALIQGALGVWAFADKIPYTGSNGYFNSVIAKKLVRGPIVTTQSRFDKAVGVYYPLAVGVVGQVDFAEEVGRFGAVGQYGIHGATPTVTAKMLPETDDYNFHPGTIYNLESSGYIKKMDGAQGAHSDIAGPQVAHAIWQAALV
jgi:hypothetical protein